MGLAPQTTLVRGYLPTARAAGAAAACECSLRYDRYNRKTSASAPGRAQTMRGLMGLLCVWVTCVGTGRAQSPETPGPAVPTAPADPTCIPHLIDSSAPEPESRGRFFAD